METLLFCSSRVQRVRKWGCAPPPPQPPAKGRLRKLASKLVNLFETHHTLIVFANGAAAGRAPPQPPHFVEPCKLASNH